MGKGRLRRLVRELVAFLSVSGIAALISFVLFNALVHGPGKLMFDHALTAYFISSMVGMLVSYAGTRKYAFSHRDTRGPAGGAVNYFVVNVLSLLIPMGCLAFSRNVLGTSSVLADNISANVVGATLATVFRYFAFRQFVFKSRRPAKSPGQPSGEAPASSLGRIRRPR